MTAKPVTCFWGRRSCVMIIYIFLKHVKAQYSCNLPRAVAGMISARDNRHHLGGRGRCGSCPWGEGDRQTLERYTPCQQGQVARQSKNHKYVFNC